MRNVIGWAVVVAVLAIGCWRQAPPAKPANAVPPVGVRDLGATEDPELLKAFADNPVAAKRKYAASRFRFQLSVGTVTEGGTLYTPDGPWLGSRVIVLRDPADVEKVVIGRPFVFEGTPEEYGPGHWRWVDVTIVP